MTQKATPEFRAAEEYRAKPDPLDEHEEFRRLSIEGTLEHFDRYVAEDR
jgi:hypothetical protein